MAIPNTSQYFAQCNFGSLKIFLHFFLLAYPSNKHKTLKAIRQSLGLCSIPGLKISLLIQISIYHPVQLCSVVIWMDKNAGEGLYKLQKLS